ncbi:protein Shroom3 isoform X2 [Erpetoichthys calabaricus]|uniref:protein Shroom3 isoform X2 n=1 Tax=Erpetoichthys calabaricus TaxID=27687 RepID=UPI002234DAAD|nr:protein Shroom3 isoform X2 [Erpetoichthys calabaricus]
MERRLDTPAKQVYVEVFLQGGAPWGFTLKGGLEHGAPLVISKVEEGGKAALLKNRLQVGDEVVSINEVELCGSRQEAISLVKGSYKTLKLIVLRQSEPGCRPHSWHSTKLGENQQDPSMMQISQGTISTPWHQTYHSSSSTSDLSGYDHGFLRKSPDQYSSRGSMESLDHGHLAYSSCHQLSPAKSTNSIDQFPHLHSKRDSAYSSFSTSSSIPDYPSQCFSKERSYSMDSMHLQRGSESIKQADIRYVRTVYDPHRGISEEQEVSSSVLHRNKDGKIQTDTKGGHNCSSNSHNTNRHSIGSVWGNSGSSNPSESDNTGPPAPPLRRDSYAATKHHERPSSWSSLEQARSARMQQKGSWSQSGSSGSSGKSSFSADTQLHTVVEKSPESSPTVKPKQTFAQSPAPGRPMLPTGVYPVPQPEPHYAQVPSSCPSSVTVLYPALAKESGYISQKAQATASPGVTLEKENLHQSNSTTNFSITHQARQYTENKYENTDSKMGLYRPHFASMTEINTDSHAQNEIDRGSFFVTHQSATGNCSHQYPNAVSSKPDQKEKKHIRQEESKSEIEMIKFKEEQDESKAERPYVKPVAHPWGNYLEKTMYPNGQFNADRNQRFYGSCSDILLSDMNDEFKNQALHRHSGEPSGYQLHIPCSPRYNDFSPQPQPSKNLDHCRPRYNTSSVQNCQARKSDVTKLRCSVLEKVNQIEQREQEKQRAQSTSSIGCNNFVYGRLSQASSGRSSYTSIEDIRSRLNFPDGPSMGRLHSSQTSSQNCNRDLKSSSVGDELKQEQENEFISHRRRKSEHGALNDAPGKPVHLQRSKSTFQLSTEEEMKENKWKSEFQDISSGFVDNTFNRAYRNSIKDAQSKVLRATSFKRKDLEISPPNLNKPKLSQEKPSLGNSAWSAARINNGSRHAPKERQTVAPEEVSSILSPQPLNNLPAPYSVSRIGGRKRLTAEQKKRSYSEPEKMNEVGVCDSEPLPVSMQKKTQHFLHPETSVADRRRMFENEGRSHTTSLNTTTNLSRPELKQLQQNAIADYIERKTGRRPSRDHSLNSFVGINCSESQSLSSASSLNSLQDQTLYKYKQTNRNSQSTKGSSTLPPGLQVCFDLEEKQSRLLSSNYSLSAWPTSELHQRCHSSEMELNQVFTVQQAQAKASSHLHHRKEQSASGKSASAEDLLEHSENRPIAVHVRSRSSPSAHKDFAVAVSKLFDDSAKNLDSSADTQSRYLENEDKCSNTPKTSTLFCQAGSTKMQRNSQSPSNTLTCKEEFSLGSNNISSMKPDTVTLEHNAKSDLAECGMSDGSSNSSLLSSHNQILCNKPSKMQLSAPLPSNIIERYDGNCQDNDVSTFQVNLTPEDNLNKNKLPKRPPLPKFKWINSSQDDLLSVQSSPLQNTHQATEIYSSSSETETETSSPTSPRSNTLCSLRISESQLQFVSSPSSVQDDDDVFIPDTSAQSNPVLDLPSEIYSAVPLHNNGLKEPSTPTVHKQTDRAFYSSPQENQSQRVFVDDKKKEELRTSPADIDRPFQSKYVDLVLEFSVVNDADPTDIASSCMEGHQSLLNNGKQNITESLTRDNRPLIKCDDSLKSVQPKSPPSLRKEKSAEDIRSEELAKEIITKDKSLAHILDPDATLKTTMDLMEGIFPKDSEALRQSQLWRNRKKRLIFQTSQEDKKMDRDNSACPSSDPLSPKVKILHERQDLQAMIEVKKDEEVISLAMNEKKMELVNRISSKLEVLRSARKSLSSDILQNMSLGEEMETLIKNLCKPNEFDKYKMFIGDLEKIVNLLLSLSGRLARVENVLNKLDKNASAEEWNSLNQKRKMLCGQHEDARELKENLDRREQVVLDILGNYLTSDQLQEYQHFVKMKSALIIEQRELDEKIKLGEDQLKHLLDSLPPNFITITDMSTSSSSTHKDSTSTAIPTVRAWRPSPLPPPLTTSL